MDAVEPYQAVGLGCCRERQVDQLCSISAVNSVKIETICTCSNSVGIWWNVVDSIQILPAPLHPLAFEKVLEGSNSAAIHRPHDYYYHQWIFVGLASLHLSSHAKDAVGAADAQ